MMATIALLCTNGTRQSKYFTASAFNGYVSKRNLNLHGFRKSSYHKMFNEINSSYMNGMRYRNMGYTCPTKLSSSVSMSTDYEDTEVRKAKDKAFMRQAISNGEMGLGGTFPNPAVGCVIIDGNGDIIGQGFHPKAGMPHAEVFALLETSGAVKDGIIAAKSVLPSADDKRDESRNVANLLAKYSAEGGAQELFGDCLTETRFKSPTTAYVTLEPCCHFGKTPPCALTFVHAGVDRVVIGCRDPNPRVDGGGVKLLQDNGIAVDFIRGQEEEKCANLVKNFIRRITNNNLDYSYMKGAHRSVLRSISGRRKADGTMPELTIAIEDDDQRIREEEEDVLEEAVKEISLKPSWLEEVDRKLWEEEIILLRLGGVVAKKKAAKLLGARIADELGATVAQVLGHTVLLYRPASPPIIDLDKMINSRS